MTASTSETFHIKPSQYYLILGLSLYILSFIVSYWYSPSLLITALLWGILGYYVRDFWYVAKLHRAKAVIAIALEPEILTLYYRNGSEQRFALTPPSFFSRYCVILRAGKYRVVIFKDGIKNNKMTMLCRYLSIYAHA